MPPQLSEILKAHALRLEFQPIVDLDSHEVVGFEALMRGPVGPLESPMALITAAQEEGVLEELDRLARFTALFAVAVDDLEGHYRLFLNSECSASPDRLDTELTFLEEMAPGVQPVLEVTERATGQATDLVVGAVEVARSHGWLVALDDFGEGHSSPDLLTSLRPDFVKIGLDFARAQRPEVCPTLEAVRRYIEESGAALIAERIETAEQLRYARTLGATWGQGYLFGAPGRLPTQALDAVQGSRG